MKEAVRTVRPAREVPTHSRHDRDAVNSRFELSSIGMAIHFLDMIKVRVPILTTGSFH